MFGAIIFLAICALIMVGAIYIISHQKEFVCTRCHHIGPAAKKLKGSMGIEIILWLFLILPGLIYTAYRMSNEYKACRACGSIDVIPVDTPRGEKLVAEIES